MWSSSLNQFSIYLMWSFQIWKSSLMQRLCKANQPCWLRALGNSRFLMFSSASAFFISVSSENEMKNDPFVQMSAAAASSNITLTLQLKKLQKSNWKFAQWVCSFPSIAHPSSAHAWESPLFCFLKMWGKLKAWLWVYGFFCFFKGTVRRSVYWMAGEVSVNDSRLYL